MQPAAAASVTMYGGGQLDVYFALRLKVTDDKSCEVHRVIEEEFQVTPPGWYTFLACFQNACFASLLSPIRHHEIRYRPKHGVHCERC